MNKKQIADIAAKSPRKRTASEKALLAAEILKANPVLKSDGFVEKARRWNVLLEQAQALGLTAAEQVEFIKKGMQ